MGGITNLAAYCELNFNNQSSHIPGAPLGTDQTGVLQVKQAFDSLENFPIAFMAVAVEPIGTQTLSQDEAVQRIADAVQTVRSQGIPAIIYTRDGTSHHWDTITGDSEEIQGVPLWDVDPLFPAHPSQDVTPTDTTQPTLDGFTGYGGFTTRIGRQYVLDRVPTLEGIPVDCDIFDASAFSLPKPLVGCMPALTMPISLTRSGSNIVITGSLNNNAPSPAPFSDALATRITTATLTISAGRATTVSTTTALPVRLNTIPVGGGAMFQLNFLSSMGVPGTPAVLRVQGTYGGGSFAFSVRKVLP